MYPLGTWFVSGIRVWIPCIKEIIIIIIVIISSSLSPLCKVFIHIPETNHVPRGYVVAAILSLLFMVPLFLVPALALLFFMLALFKVCVLYRVWLFSVAP